MKLTFYYYYKAYLKILNNIKKDKNKKKIIKKFL